MLEKPIPALEVLLVQESEQLMYLNLLPAEKLKAELVLLAFGLVYQMIAPKYLHFELMEQLEFEPHKIHY